MALPELPPHLKVLYPFTSNWFAHPDGVRQHFAAAGEGDDLTVFVHGNPSWSWLWRDLAAARARDGRVLLVDHVGCGLSDKPARYPFRLATHIANLTALLADQTFRRLHLCIHDWGGPIGLGAASQFADRLDRVVITNTSAFPLAVGDWRIEVCRWPLIGPFLSAGLGLFPRGAVRFAVRKTLSPAVRDGFLFPYRRSADRRAIGQFVRDIPLRPNHPSWAALQKVEGFLEVLRAHPVLITWGGADFCFDNRFLAEWQNRLPDATVVEYPAAGHYLLEDCGTEAIPVICDFLRGE